MDRSEGVRIHVSNLKQGQVYHFHARSLGRANLKYIGGSKFQVVAGFLQSQKDKKKRWNEGEELTLPMLDSGTFYELHEPGDVE